MKNQQRIERLREITNEHIQSLCDVLVDCVEGGASVGFMLPFTRDRAFEFWSRVGHAVAAGKRALLVARDDLGICGTVQLILDLPENQPHRADLTKMLVHRRARRQGLGADLMRAAESMARDCGKTLIVLDAVTNGDAARLYERLNWVRVGDIPNYALMPNGEPCSTTCYYRILNKEHTKREVFMIADTPNPPYYAVIFTSERTAGDSGYQEMAELMVGLAREQDGFLGIESVREELGITVSYWRDLSSIQKWRDDVQHTVARKKGRSDWYRAFKTRIALVERDYGFARERTAGVSAEPHASHRHSDGSDPSR